MVNKNIWLSSVYLVRDVMLTPTEVFRKTKNGETQKEVLIVFCAAALISLLKSFSARRQFVNFFADESLNRILSILSIPQLKWFVTYLIYFVMICIIFTICRLFGKTNNLKALMLAFMSISGIGIVSQTFFYPIHFVLPKNIAFIGSYCVYLWVVGLSIRAIQITENLSLSKALASFLPPAIVFVVICGMAVVSPYLAWLTG
jgi:Yip1 domain